jgi:hypothetical protein
MATHAPHAIQKLRSHPNARRPMPFRVTGSDLGDFYKDDNGKLWKYETKAGVPAGQVRASTDQYGGVTSPWYDRPVLFGDDHEEVNAWIDAYSPSDSGSSDTSSSTKTTPKTSAPKPSGGSTLSKSISKATVPISSSAKPTVWGYVALVAAPATGWLFKGPIGAAVGGVVGIAALLASRQ